jgi:hypothetical protein
MDKIQLTEIEKHVAKRTLEYKGGVGALLYFSTIWGKESILIMFNSVSRSIVNVMCSQDLSEEDIDLMEKFLNNYKSL